MRVAWTLLATLQLLLAAAGTSAVRAADIAIELPATAAANRLTEVLRLINAGRRDSLLTYARLQFVPSMLQPDADSIVDFLYAQFTVNGGYDIRRVLQSAPDQVSVLVQGRTGQRRWRRLVVGAEPSAPHRVSGIFLFESSEALAPTDSEPGANADLPARLAATIDRMAARGEFSGTVCLMRGDSTVLSCAWGLADREAGIPMRPDTRLTIASVGKLFTSVAIGQLVEAGEIGFDRPAALDVPRWLAPQSRSVTVAQLLEHRSGLGDFLGAVAADRSTRSFDRLEDYRAFAAADTPAFAPGTGFRYSNAGFLVLGAIVESKSGTSWDRWLASRVFDPAGMRNTRAFRASGDTGAVAAGYERREDGSWRRVARSSRGSGSPAGGAVSTAGDLAAFARALVAGRLVSPAMLDSLTTPRGPMVGTGLLYGRGFTILRGERGRRVWGHAGGTAGVGALLEVYEREGWVLAVLSNTTDGAVPVGDAWRDLLASVAASGTPH